MGWGGGLAFILIGVLSFQDGWPADINLGKFLKVSFQISLCSFFFSSPGIPCMLHNYSLCPLCFSDFQDSICKRIHQPMQEIQV